MLTLDPSIVAQVKGSGAAPAPSFELDPSIVEQVKSQSTAPAESATDRASYIFGNNESPAQAFGLAPSKDDIAANQADAQARGAELPKTPLSYGTQALAEFADQPHAKMAAYAKERFPNEPLDQSIKRYGMVNNKIVFVGQDGHLYLEDQPGAASELVGKSLPIAGNVLGGIGGGMVGNVPGAIAGAAGGAALGELGRNAIAHYALGENKSATDIATGAGLEGVIGATSEAGGRLVGKAIEKGAEKFLNPQGAIYSPEAIANQQAADALDLGKLSEAEATGSKSAIEKERTLRGTLGGADKFEASDQARAPKVVNATQKFLDMIAPAENVPNAAEATRGAAQASIGAAKDERTLQSSPLYKAAREQKIPEDSPILQNEVIQQTINSIKNDPVYKTALATVPDNSIEMLDNVKKVLGGQIKAEKRAGQDYRASLLTGIQKNLLEEMDKISPDYEQARLTFAKESQIVNPLEQGLIGKIANIKDIQLKSVAKTLFDPAQSDPRVLEKAVDAIHAQSPEALNAIVRSHLQSQFANMKAATSENGNTLARAFANNVIGTPQKKQLLYTALKYNPEAQSNLAYIEKVFPLLGKASAEGSPTANRLGILETLKGQNKYSIAKAALSPMQTLKNVFSTLEQSANKDAYAAATDAMLNPQFTSEMQAIRKLKPGSAESASALTNLLTRIMQQETASKLKFNPDEQPQVLQDKQ
jgi:hypothetical protein